MSIQRIAKKLYAADKSVTIVRKNNGRIRLVYRGFGAENLSGGLTPSGIPLQKKVTRVTAGDIIEIKLSDSVVDEYIDMTVPAKAVTYVNAGQYTMHAPSNKEIFHINLDGPNGIEDIHIPFKVLKPLEFQLSDELLVGIDLFLDEAGWGANERDTAKRRWTKELEAAGLNFGHSTLHGGTWINGFNDFLIGKIDGKFHLETLGDVKAYRYQGDIYNRRALGIHDQVDLWDMIGFKMASRWARNPLNALNNHHGEIVERELFEGSDGQPPCEMGKMQNWNKWERGTEGKCGAEKLQAVYRRHVELMQELTPPGVWICTGNELQERSTEREILRWLDRSRNPLWTNNEHLWLGRYGDNEGWQIQQYIGNHIVYDADFLPRVDGIRIHHAHPATLLRQLDWLEPVRRTYPKKKFHISTDGTQPRLTRQQQRELLELVRNIKDEFNIVALSYKTISVEDTSSLISFLGGLM